MLQYHPDSSGTKQKQNKPLPFSIPESKLTWKENPGSVMSTHMLVFKAKHTYVKKVEGKKSSHSTLDNKNSCRKNVAVALNRLNQADIARAKQEAVNNQEQVQSNTSTSLMEARISLLDTHHGRVNGQLSRKELKNHLCDVKASKELALTKADVPASSNYSIVNSHHASVVAHSTSNITSNPSVVQRRPKVKIVREKKDAAVMTDLVFGTDELSAVYQTKKSSTESVNSNDSQTTPSKANSTLPATISPHDPKDKCSSPISKFPLKNHSVKNGFSILSPPEVVAVQSGDGEVLLQSRAEISTALDRSTEFVKESHLTCEEREKVMGSEMNGEHSLTVSIPRNFYSSTVTQHSSVSEVVSTVESVSVSQSGRDSEFQTQKSSVYKRRSEIQLLYDGDKPRGQGISADEIPMFTAEDLSQISTSKPNWHGSSTRKVTPPEHFAYSLPDHSPKKVNTGNSSYVSSPTSNSTIVNGVDSSRKRPLDEADKGSLPTDSFSSPPLAKQARISSPGFVERSDYFA